MNIKPKLALKALVTSLSWLCLASTANAQTVAGSHCSASSCYTAISKSSIQYNIDRADCQSRGGDLATIADQAENDAVVAATDFCPTSAAGFVEAIIGLNDLQTEGQFTWVDGSPLGFTNWKGGEPNNVGNQDLGEIRGTNSNSPGKWDDTRTGKSGTPRCYVCEVNVPWQASSGGTANVPANALVSEGTYICRHRAPSSGHWIPGRVTAQGCAPSNNDAHNFTANYEVLTTLSGSSSFGWQSWPGTAPSNAVFVDTFGGGGHRLVCRVPGVGPGTLTPGNSCRVRKLPIPGGGLHETHSLFEILVFNP